MKKILVLALNAICAGYAMAGDPKFPVSEIKDDLKVNANVVIRRNDIVYTITSISKATIHVYEAITILNEKGKRYASEVISYDKLSKVTSFKGSVYDGTGELIKRSKGSDVYDQAAFDGFSLYSDARLKALSLSQVTYPYTVEYEYEIEYKYLFMIPGMDVIPGENIAVQHESYTLEYPKELMPRFKLLNTDQKPTRQDEVSTAWTFENIKAVKYEPHSPPADEIFPKILVAPTSFEYDGYVGKMDSWAQLGKWIGTLNKGRNVLPEATKQKVKQLTASLNTREEKVKAIYEYLQNKTRYVSIQLGIGGFQPFEASVVDETGYGDCKALSNYMVAMLDLVDIKAHYTLIRAGEGEDKMVLDFPSSQFNHAVVFVPNEKDTLWLECTSQTNPFGYSGTFTGDRKALAITDDGAKVVNTPVYSAEQNMQVRRADVIVDATGDAKAKVSTLYAGLQYENGDLNMIIDHQFDEKKKWVQKNTQIPSFDVNSFSMTNNKNRVPSAVVGTDLTLKRYATVSGKRLFLVPNLMNRSTHIPEKVEQRKTNVVRRMSYTDVDSITFHVPEELYLEFLPQPAKITSRFGEYESSLKFEQGKLVYVRRLIMKKGEFPPSSYNEFIEFYKNINKADNLKLVFLNKT